MDQHRKLPHCNDCIGRDRHDEPYSAYAHQEPERLFEDVYSPRVLTFYLAHWEELQEMAHGSGGSSPDYLQHEWKLIQRGLSDAEKECSKCSLACICHCIEDRGGYPASTRGGGGSGDAGGRTRRIIADLEHAANMLPAHWQATRRIFEQQGREGQWLFRRDVAAQAVKTRPQDRVPEPPGSQSVAIRMMAVVLGWKERRENAA